MNLLPSKIERLRKKARRGFRGYPVATVACYGPDDRRATKIAVGIVRGEGQEADALERWFSDSTDVRKDPRIAEEILDFIQSHGALTVVMPDRIISCPHEEAIDYPEGETCPKCPFWADRDRWKGTKLT